MRNVLVGAACAIALFTAFIGIQMLFAATPSQTAPTVCTKTQISGATTSELLALIADQACLDEIAGSIAGMKEARSKKIAELAALALQQGGSLPPLPALAPGPTAVTVSSPTQGEPDSLFMRYAPLFEARGYRLNPPQRWADTGSVESYGFSAAKDFSTAVFLPYMAGATADRKTNVQGQKEAEDALKLLLARIDEQETRCTARREPTETEIAALMPLKPGETYPPR